jgi:hypothetical protein
LISEITLAMTHGLGLKKIASTIHPDLGFDVVLGQGDRVS